MISCTRMQLTRCRGIPVMMGFTSKKYPSECRLEASNFIQLLCHTSVLTLQMFISYVHQLAIALPCLNDILDVAVSRFLSTSSTRISPSKRISSCTRWAASALSSSCKAQRQRTTSAECSFAKGCWTRYLLRCSTLWSTEGPRRTR